MNVRSRLVVGAALMALAPGMVVQTASAQGQVGTSRSGPPAKKNLKINVYFQKVDDKGQIILKYGSVLLTTRLAGIRLRDGSAGVLSLVLPTGNGGPTPG